MATLPTLVPTGDAQVGTWTTDAGGTTSLWQKIEEGVGTATDTNDFVRAPTGTTNTTANQYETFFTSTPSDFLSMTTLSVNVRYNQTGRSDDTLALVVRIEDANGTALTNNFTISAITTTTFTNTGASALTLTTAGTNAAKATWDAAYIVLSQTYTLTMANDNARVQVSAVELTGTYASGVTASPATITATTTMPAPTESVGATVTPATILATTASDATTTVVLEVIAAPTIGVAALGTYAMGLISSAVAAVNATSSPSTILTTITLPDANGQPKMIIGVWEIDAAILAP